jgi:two-component system, sensor histidine kinase
MRNPDELHSVNDLHLLRVEQAKLLKERVVGSCMIVLFIISYTTAILAFVQTPMVALLWFALGSAMVLVTYLYARFAVRGVISSETSQRFLIGHCIVSAATGLVWSGFAIWNLDYDQLFTVFFGCFTVCSITLGGVVPRSAYRPTYVALASTALPPLAVYILITAPGALSLIGLGLLFYFLFLMVVSAKVEIDTRETIAAKNAHQLNEMILARNKVYRDANADKMRFMSAVAHDFAQPLNAQGFFIAGLRSTTTTPEQNELLDRIDECLQSQRSMLRGLTEISRLEHGNTELHIEVVELNALCENAVQQIGGDGAGIAKITTNLASIEVTTDPALLSRIVRNLVSNAVKFTPRSGEIEVSLKPGSNGAIIEVKDTGPGISDEDKERIFAEFTQLEHGEQTGGGLGLGLSIVKRLCEKLEIGIECQSQEGVGTSFILTVPPDCAEYAGNPFTVQDMHPFEQKPLVLVADKDRASLDAITTALRGWDCTVITAGSQDETLSALDACDAMPVLMIIDYRLDSGNGTDTIGRVRDEFNANIPAIIIGDFHKDPGKVVDQDRVISLSKPIDPKAVWLAMQEQLFAEAR